MTLGANDSDALQIDVETMFVLSESGRIARENDPDGSEGPRLAFMAGPMGERLLLRHDVDEDTVRRVTEVVSGEPGWADPQAEPWWLQAATDLLSRAAPVQLTTRSFIWRMPHDLPKAADVRIVAGDSPDGDALLAQLTAAGMPQALIDAGFKSVEDLWAPWCVAMVGEDIAALAFAARLGARGAELGVYTLSGFRGRGLAAAVAAAWTGLPSLVGRELFYSALGDNRSSHRVTERLDLPRFGVGVRIV